MGMVGTNIQAIYYAVYQEKNDLGIVGWAFKTEEDAKQARDKLVEKHGDRFTVWLSKKYVLALFFKNSCS